MDGEPTYRLGGYREHAPPGELARYVETAWVYARPTDAPGIPGRGHRVLPDAAVSVAFECRRDAAGRVLDGRVVLVGPVVRPRFFAPEAGSHLEAVRIRPEWAMDLLGVDPAEHHDAIPALRAAAVPAAALRDRLMATTSSGQAVALVLAWVSERATTASSRGPAALAHAALQAVRAARGTTADVHRIARELGVSDRHLRRTIRERTGRSPKSHHRLLRLGRAVAAADRSGRAPPWARLALLAGFYDQSHLIREFRALVGSTPAETHAERAAQR